MPEALIAIPQLGMPTENSNETDTTSTATDVTDRSTSSLNSNSQLVKKLSVGFQSKNKWRKSTGKRLQKKIAPKVNSQQKTTAALQLKSHIPRPLLLTPSTSSASLATNVSLPSPLVPIERTALARKPLTAQEKALTSTLQRQKTVGILAFRQRKSISQMDFNRTRRNMHFPVAASPMSTKDDYHNEKSLMPCPMCPQNQNSLVHKLYQQDNYYYSMQERDARMAGMRIFAIIMLNAWRKRRDEVKHLREEVTELKRVAVKAKNQIHVINTLFRVERQRNDELNCQLKRSLGDINETKSSCESLTTSLISLKADKALLEQQFQIKEQELDTLNTLLSQTKSDLFKSMSVQRELQASLSKEQRKVQSLENQKNDLIDEIFELSNEAKRREEALGNEIQAKIREYAKLKHELGGLEEKIKSSHESKELQWRAREERMNQEIEMLGNELKMLQECLEEATFGNRLRNYWHSAVAYQKVTLQMLHWLAFYVLPATPPPKMNALPFGLFLDKALSIVKR